MLNAPPEQLLQSAIFWAIAGAIVGLIINYVAWRRNLFALDEGHWDGPHWRFWQVLVMFAILLFVSPLLTQSIVWIVKKYGGPLSIPHQIVIMQSTVTIVTALLFWVFSIALARGCFRATWRNHQKESTLRDIGVGALYWIVALPVVVCVMNLFEILTYYLFGAIGTEQSAVRFLRQSISNPLLFGTVIVAVTLGAPFIEEYIFRGCLQGWLRRHVSQWNAVLITSALFSLSHFAAMQRYGNIPIIASLFVLSLYLGWEYEKRRSLWSPIATHFIFNATSVIFILSQ